MCKDLSNYILNEVKLKNGKDLILRRPSVDDAQKMIEYLNIVGGESDNLLFGKDSFHLTVEQEMNHIRNISNDSNTLMILGIIDDDIASVAQISASSRIRIAHNSELSISVKKKYWRNGVGSAVMKELIHFAKEQGTIKNISLGGRSGNDNAIALYERYGFCKIGSHKDFFNINGNFYDEILMDLYIK